MKKSMFVLMIVLVSMSWVFAQSSNTIPALSSGDTNALIIAPALPPPAAAPPAAKKASSPSSVTIKGKVYFDFFYAAAVSTNVSGGDLNANKELKHPTTDGRYGFQIRRIYLTFNRSFNDDFSGRIRFEAGHSAFKDSAISEPKIKDAYLKWKYKKNNETVIGISSPPTFSLLEKFWGYRSVEKSAPDLFGIRSSRDLGVSLKGTMLNKKLQYHIMFGNGDKGNVDEWSSDDKTVYSALTYIPVKNITIQGHVDGDIVAQRKDEKFTGQFFCGFGDTKLKSTAFRAGLSATYQEKARHRFTYLFSLPVIVRMNDSMNIFFRSDYRMYYEEHGQIDAFTKNAKPVKDAAELYTVIGTDVKLEKNIHFQPNVKVGYYIVDADSVPKNGMTDAIPSLTVYVAF